MREYRGYGLGRAFMQGVLEWARAHPAEISEDFIANLKEIGAAVRATPGGKWSVAIGRLGIHVWIRHLWAAGFVQGSKRVWMVSRLNIQKKYCL